MGKIDSNGFAEPNRFDTELNSIVFFSGESPITSKNCSSKCAYDCAQHRYTIQHRTVL